MNPKTSRSASQRLRRKPCGLKRPWESPAEIIVKMKPVAWSATVPAWADVATENALMVKAGQTVPLSFDTHGVSLVALETREFVDLQVGNHNNWSEV